MDKFVNKASHASVKTDMMLLQPENWGWEVNMYTYGHTHTRTQALNIHNEAVTEFSRQLKWLSSTPAYRAPEDLDSKLNKVNIHKIRYTSVHICTFRNQRWCSQSDTHQCSPDKQSPSCPFFGPLIGICPLPPPPSTSGSGMRASQSAPSRRSFGLCHVAFAGDPAWASRMRREKR